MLKFVVHLILSLAFLTIISNQIQADENSGKSQRKSVGDFASSTGSIDFDVLRRTGYEGPLDLEGVNVFIDSVTGEPLVEFAQTSGGSLVPDDIYWDNTISPLPGVNGEIKAMAVHGSRLYVGGEFSEIGGITANHIA